MEDKHTELKQEYDQDGSLRSHSETRNIVHKSSGHTEIVNMAISVILAITATFACTMILIGAMTVIFSHLPKTEVTK